MSSWDDALRAEMQRLDDQSRSMKHLRITKEVVGHSWLITGEHISYEEWRRTCKAHTKAQREIKPPALIKAAAAVIGFNPPEALTEDPPRPIQIRVGPVLGKADRPVPKWVDGYWGAAGAVRPKWRAMPNAAHAVSALLATLRHLTDSWHEMPPDMVHLAFTVIEEYGLALKKWEPDGDELGCFEGPWSDQVYQYGQWWGASLDELSREEWREWFKQCPDTAKKLAEHPEWRARHPDLVET